MKEKMFALCKKVSCFNCFSKFKFFKGKCGSNRTCQIATDPENSSCKSKKCCPCSKLLKFALAFLVLFIANTYLGFSNMAIERYLHAHPETIIKSIENHFKNEKNKREKESTEKTRSVFEKLSKNSTLPYFGNKDGEKIVVELFDYNCGYCKKAHDEITIAVKKDPQIKVLLVNLPIMSEASMIAAKASIALNAMDIDMAADFHHRLMRHGGKLSNDDVINALKASTKSRFVAVQDAMKSKNVEDTVSENYEIAKQIGIQGTPAFLIAGKLHPGFMTADEILKAVK